MTRSNDGPDASSRAHESSKLAMPISPAPSVVAVSAGVEPEPAEHGSPFVRVRSESGPTRAAYGIAVSALLGLTPIGCAAAGAPDLSREVDAARFHLLQEPVRDAGSSLAALLQRSFEAPHATVREIARLLESDDVSLAQTASALRILLSMAADEPQTCAEELPSLLRCAGRVHEGLLPILLRAIGDIAPYGFGADPDGDFTLHLIEETARERVGSNARLAEQCWFEIRRMSMRLGSTSDTDMRRPDMSVEELVAVMNRNVVQEREVAAAMLGARGAGATSALGDLSAVLGARARPQQWDALRGFHDEVLPLEDRFHGVAARALIDIDALSDAGAIAYGYVLVNDPDRDKRRDAAVVLGWHPGRAGALESLMTALRDRSMPVVRAAIRAIASLGVRAAAAEAALRELTSHGDEEIAASAKRALRAVRGEDS